MLRIEVKTLAAPNAVMLSPEQMERNDALVVVQLCEPPAFYVLSRAQALERIKISRIPGLNYGPSGIRPFRDAWQVLDSL